MRLLAAAAILIPIFMLLSPFVYQAIQECRYYSKLEAFFNKEN